MLVLLPRCCKYRKYRIPSKRYHPTSRSYFDTYSSAVLLYISLICSSLSFLVMQRLIHLSLILQIICVHTLFRSNIFVDRISENLESFYHVTICMIPGSKNTYYLYIAFSHLISVDAYIQIMMGFWVEEHEFLSWEIAYLKSPWFIETNPYYRHWLT